MRAIVQRELGPPGVLRIEQAPDLEPGAGQVLVDVEIAGITFIETQLRSRRSPATASAVS
jgi:NADPH2:quinone reductase